MHLWRNRVTMSQKASLMQAQQFHFDILAASMLKTIFSRVFSWLCARVFTFLVAIRLVLVNCMLSHMLVSQYPFEKLSKDSCKQRVLPFETECKYPVIQH